MDNVIVIRNCLTFDVADQGGYTVRPEAAVEAAFTRLGVDIAIAARANLADRLAIIAQCVAELRGIAFEARPQGKEITDLVIGACGAKSQAA